MNWSRRASIASQRLRKQKDALALKLLRACEQIQAAERHRIGLEVLLDVRQERVAKLTEQVDQLRQQNRQLNDRLVEMVKLAPPGDAVTLAPKEDIACGAEDDTKQHPTPSPKSVCGLVPTIGHGCKRDTHTTPRA